MNQGRCIRRRHRHRRVGNERRLWARRVHGGRGERRGKRRPTAHAHACTHTHGAADRAPQHVAHRRRAIAQRRRQCGAIRVRVCVAGIRKTAANAVPSAIACRRLRASRWCRRRCRRRRGRHRPGTRRSRRRGGHTGGQRGIRRRHRRTRGPHGSAVERSPKHGGVGSRWRRRRR